MTNQERKEQLQKIIDSLKPREPRDEFEGRLVDLLDNFIFDRSQVRKDADATINHKRIKDDYIDALIKLYKEGI
jgi:hypothetical protein